LGSIAAGEAAAKMMTQVFAYLTAIVIIGVVCEFLSVNIPMPMGIMLATGGFFVGYIYS
jgi:hypothetical protein